MWQPIETAPKDGSTVDLWVCVDGRHLQRYSDCKWRKPEQFSGYKMDNGWCIFDGEYGWVPIETDEGITITHWMPLPNPPEQ